MINFKDVENRLIASPWTDGQKGELAKILPQLGPALLSHLYSKVTALGSELVADEIIELASLEPEWYSLLQNNKAYRIKDFLLNNYRLLAFDFSAIIAIIEDIRNNRPLEKFLTKDISDMFDCLEVDGFKELPIQHINRMLRERAVHLAAITDLFMEIKRYCYSRGIEEMDSKAMQMMKLSLEDNTENVGNIMLVTEDRKLEPNIHNWIELFVAQGAKSLDRSVFNVAAFMTKDPHFRALNPADQRIISSLLKLYNWFFNPVISENEIKTYNDMRVSIFEFMYLNGEPMSEIRAGLDLEGVDVSKLGVAGKLDAVKPSGQSLQDIAAGAKNMSYNGQPKQPSLVRGGLVLDRQTNIVVEDEAKRIKEEMQERVASIESKLAELKKRKQK